MDKKLLENLLNKGLSVCIKDSSSKVIFQNSTCEMLCGKKVGGLCETPCCPKKFSAGASQDGFQFFPNHSYNAQKFDVLVLKEGVEVLLLLWPKDNENKLKLDQFKTFQLTKRETEILSLMLQGKSNSEIIAELPIAKSTLKTHLNTIYKKVPHELLVPYGRPKYIAG